MEDLSHPPETHTNRQQSLSAQLTEQLEAQETNRQNERLRVVEGLSEVRAGRLEPGQGYRFLITAAVQADPIELGKWLDGGGQGFHATDRPVNTSLIDQDHNWTFAGGNGFIITPPESGADIVAAAAVDIASSDLQPQPLHEATADELLKATPVTSYNQVNISSGKLAAVYIRVDKQGEELGQTWLNQRLRDFAKERQLPIIEIPIAPQEFHESSPVIEEHPANPGDRLWKIDIQEEGALYQIDVAKLNPNNKPQGIYPDSEGFALRIMEVDSYGNARSLRDDVEQLTVIEKKLTSISTSDVEQARAITFAHEAIVQRIAEMNGQELEVAF